MDLNLHLMKIKNKKVQKGIAVSETIYNTQAAIVRALSAGTGGDMDYIISEFGDVLGEDLINEIKVLIF